MDKIDELLDGIRVLPPAPLLLPKLLSALNDVDGDTGPVVDLITLDPALTGILLQTCNSAYYGLPSPVNDTSEAVSQLGFQTVYRIVAAASGSHCLKLPSDSGLDANQFWKHSVTTAFAAQFLAQEVGCDAGLLFTAGLLHDIGKVVLAGANGRNYARVLEESAQEDEPLAELERAAYGADHANVGGRLLKRWKLSNPMVACVQFHHNPNAAGESQKNAACVLLGDALAHSLDKSQTNEDSFINAPESALKLLKLAPEDLTIQRELLVENWHFVEGMCQIRA